MRKLLMVLFALSLVWAFNAAAWPMANLGHGYGAHKVVELSGHSGQKNMPLPEGTVVLGHGKGGSVHKIQRYQARDMSKYDPFAEDRGIPASVNDEEGLGPDESMHTPTWYQSRASDNGVMPGGVQAQAGAPI